jgi:hypothetical protein
VGEDDQLRHKLALDYRETKDLMEHGYSDDELRPLVEPHDLVYGVWLDREQPGGIDYKLLKGDLSRMQNRGVLGLACRSSEYADRIKAMFFTPDF